MTMFEKLPRFLRGSTAEELESSEVPQGFDEEINRLQDAALIGIAAVVLITSAVLCL